MKPKLEQKEEIYLCKICNEEINIAHQSLFNHWTSVKHEGSGKNWEECGTDQQALYYHFSRDNLVFVKW